MASLQNSRALQIEKLVKLYKSVAAYPSMTSARVLNVTENHNFIIQCVWTQRNLERKTNQRFLQYYSFLNSNVPMELNSNCLLNIHNFPIDATTELMSAVTEDKQYRAVLRQATIENSTKQFIEIWNEQRLLKNYDLSALDVHGDVYTDSEFGSFEWSPDNAKILYIAEKKLPKSEPFYKQKPLDKKDQEKKEDEVTVGNEYIYKPHWGEQLVGKHRPVVVVLDTTADTITALSGIPDDLSPGQVIWTKEQDIIGVAWKHEPRYLGLVACTNRTSWIFLLKNGEYQKLSNDGCAVHSPRLSPSGSYLVWLERESGGAHHNAHRLMLRDFKSMQQTNHVLVDIVQTSRTIERNKQFYGIYGRLPRRCWIKNESYLLFSTPQRNKISSYVVNIKTKNITEIEGREGSLNILDVHSDIVVFSHTSLIHHLSLLVTKFDNIDDNTKYASATPLVNHNGLEKIMYELNEYNYDNDEEIKQFNFIYFGPKNGKDKSVPLIVVPHGGPHSNYVNVFSLDYSFFVLAGFAVVLVNYRGSTGMGSATVEYLLGKVGNVDVRDCLTATNEAIKKYPWLDPENIGLCGGSHGGFLVTHLSGQAPDIFKAVVARNPVIDIAVMFSTSDIPDWCAAETSFPYDSFPESDRRPDNIEMFVKMMQCSPIVHVDKVKAPTLICIGTNDLRVPPAQGKMWYYRLKANNVKTKMLIYDDNHPLSSGPVEIDHIINDCLWLIEHMCPHEDTKSENKE